MTGLTVGLRVNAQGRGEGVIVGFTTELFAGKVFGFVLVRFGPGEKGVFSASELTAVEMSVV